MYGCSHLALYINTHTHTHTHNIGDLYVFVMQLGTEAIKLNVSKPQMSVTLATTCLICRLA